MAFYVCSDIHGLGFRFFELLKEIKFSKEDTLYILGDIIDRGPDGVKLLKYVMQQDNIKLIMGNHEAFMYSYLVNLNVLGKLEINNLDNLPSNIWLSKNNGGLETLKEFVKEDIVKCYDGKEYLNNGDIVVDMYGNLFKIDYYKLSFNYLGEIAFVEEFYM